MSPLQRCQNIIKFMLGFEVFCASKLSKPLDISSQDFQRKILFIVSLKILNPTVCLAVCVCLDGLAKTLIISFTYNLF